MQFFANIIFWTMLIFSSIWILITLIAFIRGLIEAIGDWFDEGIVPGIFVTSFLFSIMSAIIYMIIKEVCRI